MACNVYRPIVLAESNAISFRPPQHHCHRMDGQDQQGHGCLHHVDEGVDHIE